MIKKLISALLSVVLVLGSMLTISADFADYEVSNPEQGTYDITVTVTSDSDLGTITAYVKRVDDSTGEAINVPINGIGPIYGIGQDGNKSPEEDGKYHYTFLFIMHSDVQTGTYRVFFGDGIQTTKDYIYNRVLDIVDFYNDLDTSSAAGIYSQLEQGETKGFLTYDLTKYKNLDENVRDLVDQEIEGWDLSVPDVNFEEALTTKKENFKTQMDEVMLRANIANADTASFDEPGAAAILDKEFYNADISATVASFMHPETITSIEDVVIKQRFSEAVLLSVAKESDYLTLYDATEYFIDNSILDLDGTKLATLVDHNLHIGLFQELVKKDTYTFDTIESYEDVAGPLMDSLLEQIELSSPEDTTPPSPPPVGGNQGSAISTKPVEPEKDDGLIDNPATFNDLETVSWAQEAITYLAERGIVAGRGDGIFAPNDGVTREEMVKLIVTAFSDENGGVACDFSDVSADRWSYPYIATAFNLGLITGVDDSNFDPTGGIVRESLAVILYRAYNLAGKQIDADNASFTDSGKIAGYAKDAVNAMVKLGVMEGMGDGTFSPKTVVTRAQAAKVIYKLLTLIGGGN